MFRFSFSILLCLLVIDLNVGQIGYGQESKSDALPKQTSAKMQKADESKSSSPVEILATTSASNDPITKEKLDQRLAEIQADEELDELTRAELVKRCKACLDWQNLKVEANQNAAMYEAEVRNAPKLLADAKLELAAPIATPTIVVPPEATLSQIEPFADEAGAEFKAAQEVLARKEEDIKQRSDRKNEMARLIAETKQRLEETRNQLGNPPADNLPLLTQVRRMELSCRVLALESQLEMYKSETARHEAIAELLPMMRDIAKREKNACEAKVAQWQTVVTNHRKLESEKQAAEARRQVQDAHPALRSLAERNSALADQRKSLADSLARVGRQVQAVDKNVELLQQQYKKAEQRVQKAGHSATVGLMLRRQKENLPSLRECGQTLREIQSEMPKASLAHIEIEDERESLGDIEKVLPTVLASLAAEGNIGANKPLEQVVRDLLKTKLELLDSLATDYESYLDDLSDLEVSNGKLADEIQKSSNYINELVLWIRSANMLWVDDLGRAVEGSLAVIAPEPWVEVGKHCGLDTVKRPLPALGVLLIFALFLIFQARLRTKMMAACSTKSRGLSLRFQPTLQAIGLAAVVATGWPLLLAYLGWRISTATIANGLGTALGIALLYAAVLFWVSEFVKNMLRPDGPAETHLGWSTISTKLFRTKLRWLTVLGIPLAIITVGLQYFQNGEWSNSLGRLVFVIGMFLLAYFMHSILNSKESILREAISKDNGTWFARLRKLSHTVGVGVPSLLAVLAIAGYYYTALQVALRWQATLGVSLALLFGYSVAACWCLVKRRNLAIQQSRERQQQVAQGAAASESGASVPAIQIEDQQPDLTAIHEQLRYLLRHVAIVGMVVCTWFIWSDVLPALKVLDRVVLWETIVEVAETNEGLNGKLEQTMVDRPVTTTLRHLLFAGLLVVGTFIIGRNLPALLEVTLLQRTPFDKGGRHAIAVLLKYSVALTGLFLACRTLSFTWSSVQWLAAGMTVGLGFGLQEIFANFVSGLILLLERPIRVGDVITLGDVTGTVTGMRIRATTVTNWDRKELIVPNKDLITGRLLNWTLSDSTNRIVITVGVAYRSDPQRARQIILEAVASHPNVLDEPATNVTFEEFADSALNLVVRAYISSMEVRLATINDLHILIHTALRQAGIEIAFPQRDINVRGFEASAIPQLNFETKEAA